MSLRCEWQTMLGPKRCATIVAASVALTSCAVPGGTSVPQMTNVHFYPQCYQPVQQLRQADQQFQQTMMVNTAIGAVGGAAIGAAAGQNLQSTILGAVGGAVVAAAGTYAAARLRAEPNDEARRALIARDLNHDSGELQRAVIAARQADTCYAASFQQLAGNLRRGAVSKDEARQRFTEIEMGERESAAILAEYGKKAQASSEQYRVAFDQEAQKLNRTPDQLMADASAPPPRSPRAATQPVSPNTRQLAANYGNLNQQVQAVDQQQKAIERDAESQKNNMRGLGVEVG